jgi:hypothetical protein
MLLSLHGCYERIEGIAGVVGRAGPVADLSTIREPECIVIAFGLLL